ncbi:lipase secretion chaperone [Alcanivorax sp. IL3]|jgi:lipase chaperone LimK|uniref:lipase secretion chaperone n=1 Tax=Alcanivorax TaxID=59753 RepID=UPI000C57E050|nr:lipase secretion chaperone [Alcanivorax jadensis]MBG32415.1 lipase [Alcanivorax sp.]MDF1638954.1 lipase secretion chaperone [Alcanivorax jadensis]|tara:strand:- start:410 stop:1405 length:996 start_codon:yes stop_codon:yes gene_type:complete
MKRHLTLLATVGLLAAAGFWGLPQMSATTPGETQAADTLPQAARTDRPTPPQSSLPAAQALANSSLAGTTVPADLVMDGEGQLIVNSSTRAILEYFLSLSGELPDEKIRQLIQQWAKDNASSRAASDLLALLDRYNDYRQRYASGDFAASAESDIADKLNQRRQWREQIFGADAAALFADEDRYDNFSLQRQDILTSDMSDAEKERAMETLHASLPAHLADQYRQQQALQHLQDTEQSIEKTGGNSADRFAYHQQAFGDEAALRLQSLSQKRQEWQQRYQDYATQRDRILLSGLVGDDKQQQLEQLRARLFAETEQQRVAALDRLDEPASE